MVAEVLQLSHQVRRPPPSDLHLSRIDANRAMLARMVDLHYSVTQRFTGFEARCDCHTDLRRIGS